MGVLSPARYSCHCSRFKVTDLIDPTGIGGEPQITLTQYLPGSTRIRPLNSSSKSAAKICEEERCETSRSTISSMWVDSSARSTANILFSSGGSSDAVNNDAASGIWDAGCSGGVSESRMSAGNASHTSSQVAMSAAPCFINVLGPQDSLLVTFPGTA